MNASTPAAMARFPRSSRMIPDHENPATITSTPSLRCSSPRPVPNRTRSAFGPQLTSQGRITPARSSAVAAAALTFTGFFGLAESPSLTPRRHVEDANGVTEGLDRVAHPGVAGEQSPGPGLNFLIGGRELDTALVNTQRHRTGRGVLVEPVALLHDQQYHVQALALAQRDRVSSAPLPRLLLAQAGNLCGQIEALQRSAQGPLGFRVRPRTHSPSSLNFVRRRARARLARPRSLNAWCELSVGNLSGRCPHARVGLPPDPLGKGTNSSWSMWTPSSPHSTLWLTTSATPILRKSDPAPKPPSPKARS